MKFIYGTEEYLIKKEIKKFINKFNLKPIYYSDDDDVEDIILDFSTVSLFQSNKLFVIQNHVMFLKNDQVEKFLKVLSKNQDNKIIFAFHSEKLFKTNKLTNFLLKNAECIKIEKLTLKEIIPTINSIVKSKGGTIENEAVIKLSTKLPLDLRIIILEIEKLLLENKNITISMVERSIDNYIKEDVFALSNALTQKDAHGIISAYQNKKKQGEEVSLIIGQITSILSLALLISFYRKKGFDNVKIQQKTGIHAFRIKKIGELINHSSIENIKDLVFNLSDLEKDIKLGNIDSIHGIESFLLELIR